MITISVLDTTRGAPAPRIPTELDVFITGHGWREVGHGLTNGEGRIQSFGEPPAAGVYRLMLDIASYDPEIFFPSIAVTFEVADQQESVHIALSLSRFAYSVARDRYNS
ncbi:MAG TPA: hydroxyisourate hydrolase [Bryobacteraceae bacterium]|nr:hydroxyisourate hydrolase [Bryobacteraceae bacterium]